MTENITIIGAGLAGSEAALVLASRGIPVTLYEMRPGVMTPAHSTGLPAELVCSNSMKSAELPGAHGLLKKELSLLGSPVLDAAFRSRVPAGSALAVDRERFSLAVLDMLKSTPGITMVEGMLDQPPLDADHCILATGPLTADPLAAWLRCTFASEGLHFYDAIAPIVAGDSVDLGKAFFASRWKDDGDDYLNCPFTEEEYRRFHSELVKAETAAAHSFEDPKFFEACLPVEVIGQRGDMALAFGPLKPVGLRVPGTDRHAFAVCQLRREKSGSESFNLVGFQTRLTISEQQRVFRMIPGLEHAEFLRYGSVHRNTFLDSPRLLDANLSFRARPGLFLAGQICGNEGYTESIATGHLAGLFVWAAVTGTALPTLPVTTALGSMLAHVTRSPATPFTPSNIHFGLFPPLDVPLTGRRKNLSGAPKREALCQRALSDLELWITACAAEGCAFPASPAVR